ETHFKIRKNITTNYTYCSPECRAIGKSKKMNKTKIAKEEIKREFKKIIENGESITHNCLRDNHPSLLRKISRRFGNIRNLCEEIGISEKDMIEKFGFTRNINKFTLSESEIHKRLTYLKSIGRLTTSAMRTEFDDLRLEISCKKVFGSV